MRNHDIVLLATGIQLPFLASHSVQIGGADLEDGNYLCDDDYLCVILDWVSIICKKNMYAFWLDEV